MSSILKVDTINENSSGGGVTIDGYKLKDGAGTMVNAALQVVTQQATTTISTASVTEIDITTLDITITPSSTSSAIMVGIGSCPIQVPDQDDNQYWGIKIDRSIGGASASTIYTNSQMGRSTSNTPTDHRDGGGFSFIDKPNTTSECVYEFILVLDSSGSESTSVGKGMTCTSYGIEFSGATEV